MGQRFQIIIKMPDYYINENNPNNKESAFIVYHSSWLYGYTAIIKADELIKGIDKLIKNEKKKNKKYGFKGINCQELANNAIKYISYKDILKPIRITPYFTDRTGLIKSVYYENKKELIKDLKTFDNNNGILFINISKMYNLSYCFYNPKLEIKGYDDKIYDFNEASENNKDKCLNCNEYIQDYYKGKDLIFVIGKYLKSIKLNDKYPLIKDLNLLF